MSGALALLAGLVLGASLAPQEDARPRSYLTRPLYLDEEPPECRSLARILVRFAPPPEAGGQPLAGRSREEAHRRALELRAELAAGARFDELAERASEEERAAQGGVLGTFPPGLLRPDVEAFLWHAAEGEVSEPLAGPEGFELVQRVERQAGCRTILVSGQDEEARLRALAVLERVRDGEDFATLARELSDDPVSAARGGAHAVFERGANDQLLKRETFRAAVGEVFGPLETPLGWLLAKRVPPDEIPSELHERNWIRARCIFIAHKDVGGSRELTDRTLEEAGLLAEELHRRLREGEDMASLAREHDDDLDGRARAGDLGWLLRSNPLLSSALDRLFLVPAGTLLDPLPVEAGWLLLRRER